MHLNILQAGTRTQATQFTLGLLGESQRNNSIRISLILKIEGNEMLTVEFCDLLKDYFNTKLTFGKNMGTPPIEIITFSVELEGKLQNPQKYLRSKVRKIKKLWALGFEDPLRDMLEAAMDAEERLSPYQ